jgi:hypothetical protein
VKQTSTSSIRKIVTLAFSSKPLLEKQAVGVNSPTFHHHHQLELDLALVQMDAESTRSVVSEWESTFEQERDALFPSVVGRISPIVVLNELRRWASTCV